MKRSLLTLLLLICATTSGTAQFNVTSQTGRAQPLIPRRLTHPSSTQEVNSARGHLPTSSLNFAPIVIYDSGSAYPGMTAVADVNGDGRPDLLVENELLLGLLLGNGDGTFQTVQTFSSGLYINSAVAAVDVNGDGKPDVVVLNSCTDSSCSSGSVAVLLGNGDGTFQPPVDYGCSISFCESMVIADVNGDGRPDLVLGGCVIYDQYVGCNGGYLSILLGNGDGTFYYYAQYGPIGTQVPSLTAADVNGDAKIDLLAASCNTVNFFQCVSGGGGVAVLLGNGDGTFQTASFYASGGDQANSVTAADVNSDSKPDLVVSSGQEVGVLLGNGDGTFQAAVTYGSNVYVGSVAVGDMDGDGKPDLVVANHTGGGNAPDSVGVLLGNGDGTFQAEVSFSSGAYSTRSVDAVDVNGDGKPDLIATSQCLNHACTNDGALSVLINISPTLTATSLSSLVNPSSFGQLINFTAIVTLIKGTGTPTGTVAFSDGGTSLGVSSLDGNRGATLSTSTLAVGTHAITAAYSGDSNFAPSTSSVLNQVVQGSVGSVAPPNLNFSNQTLGVASSPQGVMLTNTGNIPMTISGISIGGSNSADFSQTNTCPSSLAPGIACSVNVTFTPSVVGARMASVNIIDSAVNSPQTVALSGTGIAPVVTLTPSGLNFGTQAVGTISSPQVVTLSTNGTLNITSITASAEFAESNNCGTGLPAGGSCQINVTFKPTSPGTQNGTLSVSDSGTGSPQTVALSGVGTQPAVTLSPTSLNFGNQTVGFSAQLASTLTNTGNGTLILSSIAISGVNAGDFVLNNSCPSSFLPNASCKISVTFKPSAIGSRSANLIITDNAPNSPQSLPLNGVGVLPAVTFSPTSLTFPNQVVFTTSPSQKVTLTNTGLGILELTGGATTGQFGETNSCGKSLAAGASCTFQVTFKPTSKGTLSGSLSVTDNAPGSPQKVTLTGVGTYLQITPASVNFGNQPVHTTSLPKTITISNKGTAEVTFTGITITGTDRGDFTETTTCPTHLSSGSSCFVKVKFTPSKQGTRTANVSISDDGGGSPQTVALSGTGTP